MNKLEDRKEKIRASHGDASSSFMLEDCKTIPDDADEATEETLDDQEEEGKEREFKAGRKKMEDTKEKQEKREPESMLGSYYSLLKLYDEEVAKSEGFEVSYHPALKWTIHHEPLPNPARFMHLVLHAIDCYNRKNKDQSGCGEVKFIEFLNVVGFGGYPWHTFYFTFLGQDSADDLKKTYQASVFWFANMKPVLIKFRLKPQEDNNLAPPKNPILDNLESLKYPLDHEDAERDAVFWASIAEPFFFPEASLKKDVVTYFEELEATQGYDITGFPGMARFHFIMPIQKPWNCRVNDRVTAIAKDAIHFHNREAGSQLELVTVDKVNFEVWGHPCAYITFTANDGKDGQQKIYQPKVKIILGWKNVVREVRVKPY